MKNILILLFVFTSLSAFARFECHNSEGEALTLELTEYGHYIEYFNSNGDREVSFLSTKVVLDTTETFELLLPTDGHLIIDRTGETLKATIQFFSNSLPIKFDCEDLNRQM